MNAAVQRRVAVTGVGALTPAGEGVAALRRFQAAPFAGLTPRFDPAGFVPAARLLRSMHRGFQIAAAAAVLAMRNAGLPTAESLPAAGLAPRLAGVAAAFADLSPLTPDLLALLAHTPVAANGEISWAAFAELGAHELHPFRRLTLLANMAAAHASLLFGLQGPSFTFTSGASGGAQTVIEAYWTIAAGRADLMLCQAADSPEQVFLPCARPELGGALVLEAWDEAERRGAAILAEITSGPQPCVPGLEALEAETDFPSPANGLLAAITALAGGGCFTLRQLFHPLEAGLARREAS